jgi:hypothetical protein
VSEYQYYEFRALDRPLDQQAQRALRRITSRAEITSTSLVNEYEYGDFRGDPEQLMTRYFDAFVYLSNWGSYRLMLRLPADTIGKRASATFANDALRFAHGAGKPLILHFASESEGRDLDDDSASWMASLVGLRRELAGGDHRALYLGWLRGVQEGALEDDAEEPEVPAGLRKLSASLEALAAFLAIDEGLLSAAAKHSASRAELSRSALTRQVLRLPAKDKDELLRRLLDERADGVIGELNLRFAAKPTKPPLPRRTAGELRRQAGLD